MRALALIIAAAAIATAGGARAAPDDDYSTIDKADYIFGCMASNGQSRQSLEHCSCSIDTIATILPYAEYEQAETILRMNRIAGQASEVFRTTGEYRDIVANLRRAQAEAEVKCFP